MEQSPKSEVPNTLEASLALVNEKMHCIAFAGKNEPIHTDYVPPFGDNLGYMPLQLFLISLGSCAAGAVMVLLRKMQKNVTGLEVKVSGVRREIHPTSFKEITLEFHMVSPDVTTADMDRAIALSEASICPVWAMVKGNVEVKTLYEIHNREEGIS
jgi:putative redox protein